MGKYNRMAKIIRVQRKQNKSRMVGQTFCTLASNERRKSPWLGSAWFEPGRDEARKQFIAAWKEETAQMLIKNPSLVLVD
ncbi:hypothetical protein LCGC14_1722180 [marine sediment metagenome]|uniref:Uncharacterized protein n=1 Tax=marine sediment metagenome TaxID=412755 RepID=A0A0F9HC62_9ZZZZ